MFGGIIVKCHGYDMRMITCEGSARCSFLSVEVDGK